MGHVARHAGERRISDLFGLANETHQNYYDDLLELDMLQDRLEAITEFIALLDHAHQMLPMDLPMPDNRHYRNRHA